MSKFDYYTPRELAETLLQLIPENASIDSIADICCGTWNLLYAAHTRFPHASLTGVDIDAAVGKEAIENATFLAQDGRVFAAEMEKMGIRFDLMLSNPPFGTIPPDQKKYLGESCVQKYKRYESEFLYANYTLVNDGGYLLVILPITYAKGHQYIGHRIWMAKNFDVLYVVELPTDTFGNKTLNTIALLLRKTTGVQTIPAKVFSAGMNFGSWSLNNTREIPLTQIASGEWLIMNCASDLHLNIFRGSISSQFFSKEGESILHSSNVINNGAWQPSIRNCTGVPDRHKKYAESGDIIINRIGKKAGAWSVHSGSKCLVSDCVIVIPHPGKALLEKIEAYSQNGVLLVSKLGVSTPYVSLKEISDLLNGVNEKS